MSRADLLDRPASPVPPAALRVGDHAPDLDLHLDRQHSRLHRWAGDSWAVLFTLHTGDALDRAVELRRLAPLLPEFRTRCVKLLGIASPLPDSGDGPHPFAVAFDCDGEIAQRYGLASVARSVAAIDPERRLRLLLSYPSRRERDFADVLRLIAALQQADARERAGRTDWRARPSATLGAW